MPSIRKHVAVKCFSAAVAVLVFTQGPAPAAYGEESFETAPAFCTTGETAIYREVNPRGIDLVVKPASVKTGIPAKFAGIMIFSNFGLGLRQNLDTGASLVGFSIENAHVERKKVTINVRGDANVIWGHVGSATDKIKVSDSDPVVSAERPAVCQTLTFDFGAAHIIPMILRTYNEEGQLIYSDEGSDEGYYLKEGDDYYGVYTRNDEYLGQLGQFVAPNGSATFNYRDFKANVLFDNRNWQYKKDTFRVILNTDHPKAREPNLGRADFLTDRSR